MSTVIWGFGVGWVIGLGQDGMGALWDIIHCVDAVEEHDSLSKIFVLAPSWALVTGKYRA